MAKVSDLEAIRNEKAPKCEYCGEAEHKAVFACPRVRALVYNEEEGTVTVRFWSNEEYELAG